MGKGVSLFPVFCLHRIRPHVRSPPPLISSKSPACPDFGDHRKPENSDAGDGSEAVAEKPAAENGRKIMIVVDSSGESRGAIEWALIHAVQNGDTVVLLHVPKPGKPGKGIDSASSGVCQLLCSVKNVFLSRKPQVRLQMKAAEGGGVKGKGEIIVEEARRHGVALLVMGQKKRSATWRLVMMWAGHRPGGGDAGRGRGGGTAEYCVQNAHCMAVAVRRKSKKTGGYMITTKRHRDFWLLA